jgi:cell division protein FtsL
MLVVPDRLRSRQTVCQVEMVAVERVHLQLDWQEAQLQQAAMAVLEFHQAP